MKIEIRAGRLLGLEDNPPASLTGLAKEMGLSPFQLRHFLASSAPHINRAALEAVCQYLLRHDRVQPESLFSDLLAVVPDSFWPLVAARQRINISVGVRMSRVQGLEQLVVADDAIFQSVMVNELTGTAANTPAKAAVGARHPRQVIDLRLVPAWEPHGENSEQVIEEAKSFVARCARMEDNGATVCVGSIKSNATSDLHISRAFRKAKPFVSEDTVRTADQRSVPFLMLYREHDPHPPSCWGGCVVAGDDARTSPGIYFARKPGEWDFLASGEEVDTALVFYCFYKARQNVEMVWGGYTGRATRYLAKILSDGQADCFWPPAIDNERISVGAFVVNFEFRETRQKKGSTTMPLESLAGYQVIPLTAEVLAPRLARPRT
jgi:hypothetical protein